MIELLDDPDRLVVQENLSQFILIFEHFGLVFKIAFVNQIFSKIISLPNSYCRVKGFVLFINWLNFLKNNTADK
jgi:hypothetical protein